VFTVVPGQASNAFSSFGPDGLQASNQPSQTVTWTAPSLLALTLANASITPRPTNAAQEIVEGWTPLFMTGGEIAFPPPGCVSFSAPNDRTPLAGWRVVAHTAWAGFTAIASTKAIDAQPATHWWTCGPFDLRQADKFMVQYAARLDAPVATHNDLFFGVSTDGQHFQGMVQPPDRGEWRLQRVLVEGIAQQPRVWVAWAFRAFGNDPYAVGAYLDEVKVWHYTSPPAPCGLVDPGAKGLVLTPYDPTAAIPAPIIRAGDTSVIENLQKLGVAWVRLGFQAQSGVIDLLDYDRMIDTLCAHGIRVLGLLNHEMLTRQDYQQADKTQMAAYRQEFATTAGLLARYFAGRVGAWEVWNEPNLAEGAYLSPADYAQLLQQTYQIIKVTTPQVPVLFGGLASSWRDSADYLQAVYDVLDEQLQGARPFDHLAVHPYPRKREGPNPQIYFYADQAQGYATILDKFLQIMADHGDGDKTIWISEIGFNSAKRSVQRPSCLGGVLVQEEEQASYLKQSFDLLLTQVKLWGKPEQPGVEKIFWYQYMDVGAANPCFSLPRAAQNAQTDWWFGLYRGDKVTPKPVMCAFAAYPRACGEALPAMLYLPFVGN
jgi:hypothetical protein